MNRFPLILIGMGLVATFCTVSSTPLAQADWSDNFNGGFEQFWQFGSVDGGGLPSASFSGGVVNDQLVLADPNAAASGGAGAGFGVVGEIFSDVRMTGIINPNGDLASSGTVTLLARGNPLEAKFYAAEINYTNGELIIFRNDGLGSTTNIADVTIPNLTAADSVFLDFLLVGDSLSAKAYDAPQGNLLGEVSVTDNTYTGGLSGVLVNTTDPSAPILGVWDDITATTAIPEPTTCLLAFTAMAAAFISGRKRRVR